MPDAPAILALDFDGVICDGRPEYFETSCRTYGHFWPPSTLAPKRIKNRFMRFRCVIKSGWEMPILVRALALATPPGRILHEWTAVRDEILAGFPVDRKELVRRIVENFDRIRRDWIWIDENDWINANAPYGPLEVLQRTVAEPARTVIVTTKEGEFARRILDRWGIAVADVQGKESGEHKCENLLELMERYPGAAPPTIWFVEDRLETLQCVPECAKKDPRLEKIRLFLAAWGYNTAETRAAARRDPHIRLLSLAQFSGGLAGWPD